MPDYALKTDIPTVPTKTSELTNDTGFITTIPTEYITESELNTELSTKANISDIPSLDGYATETFVTNKIAEASLSGEEIDLSGLATKDELNSSLATKSDTTHNHDTVYAPIEHEHSQYLTSVPSEYVTDEELNEKGYLTEHQDISGKADKLYVDTELAKKSDKTHTHSYNNLTDKPTIPTVDVNKNYVDTQLATKANTSDIPSLDGYATETYVNQKVEEISIADGSITSNKISNGAITNEKLMDDCVDLSKLSMSVFEGGDVVITPPTPPTPPTPSASPIFQYKFERSSSTWQNGYVATVWFDISSYSGDFTLDVSADIKANVQNIQSFGIKAFQYSSVDEAGGAGYESPAQSYKGNTETFSTISINTTIAKEKNILKVFFWGTGTTPTSPETIQFKNIDIKINGDKQEVSIDNLGYYGTACVPVITEITETTATVATYEVTTDTTKPVIASKAWVYSQIEALTGMTITDRLYGKRIGAIGDSYVYGHTLGTDKVWLKKLADRKNMTAYNYGVNGGLISGNGGVVTRYANMVSDLDYIVVFGGHNDASKSVPIGEDDSTDITTFKGALNVLCKGLQTKYPKARILFMTPSHRKGNEPPYCQAMKDVCSKYGIQVYDTYAKLGINIGDGDEGNAKQKEVFELAPLHLNELGNEYLSYKVESELLTL